MPALRNRRIETVLTMPSTRQQPSRAVSTRRHRTPSSNQSVARTPKQTTVVHRGDAVRICHPAGTVTQATAVGAANDQSNPVKAADNPAPDAANSPADPDVATAASANEDTLDAAHDQPDVDVADDPAPDLAKKEVRYHL